MLKGIEMERVVVTLLAFLNPPIDWFPMSVILLSSRRRRSPPCMPIRGDIRILTQVGCMAHNKECSDSSAAGDSFNMSFLIRKEGGKEEEENGCSMPDSSSEGILGTRCSCTDSAGDRRRDGT
jgi:hypothetical protein